ncbi:hypothetical protein BV392_09755 [Rhodovulum sulfidophilum]|nr:hypothetical protein BV392_09755 [Rhodovulum sulfidophilum]
MRGAFLGVGDEIGFLVFVRWHDMRIPLPVTGAPRSADGSGPPARHLPGERTGMAEHRGRV